MPLKEQNIEFICEVSCVYLIHTVLILIDGVFVCDWRLSSQDSHVLPQIHISHLGFTFLTFDSNFLPQIHICFVALCALQMF